MKKNIFRVMSIVLMCLSLGILVWEFGVYRLFRAGLEIGFVFLQFASMSFVATMSFAVGALLHLFSGERNNLFGILQMVAMLVVSIMFANNMITTAIAYYGKWWTLAWYPLWWGRKESFFEKKEGFFF